MCTAADMPITVIDEPFDGLDQQGVDALTDELLRWRSTKAVILVSHSLPSRLNVDRDVVLTAYQAHHEINPH